MDMSWFGGSKEVWPLLVQLHLLSYMDLYDPGVFLDLTYTGYPPALRSHEIDTQHQQVSEHRAVLTHM